MAADTRPEIRPHSLAPQDQAHPDSGSIERAVGPDAASYAPVAAPFAHAAALCPVGVFDSGMGGLSVVEEIRRVLPSEDIIFYGDNANIPYGGRSDEWLRARSLQIAEFLLSMGAKIIVVACNTASAAGLEHLRARFKAPIVGLVPAVKPAVAATHTGKIGVLATRATMRGQLLLEVIDRFAVPAGVEVVTSAPDGLVEAVERGELDTPATHEAVGRALAPMLERGVDAVVLGCTHYPYLNPVIKSLAGPGVRIIDSAGGVARQTARVLDAQGLARSDESKGSLTVYTSGDPEALGPLVRRLVGEDVPVYNASAEVTQGLF